MGPAESPMSSSRKYPEFRRAMYALIHFTVLDQDIEIPETIRRQIITNPGVERHNSCATFTINGEKKDCYLVFLTDSVFEKPGDSFFDGMYTGIVPLDASTVYRAEQVDDFWDVVGRNTDYAEDPEEIMATNAAFAILHLDDGYAGFKIRRSWKGSLNIREQERWNRRASDRAGKLHYCHSNRQCCKANEGNAGEDRQKIRIKKPAVSSATGIFVNERGIDRYKNGASRREKVLD